MVKWVSYVLTEAESDFYFSSFRCVLVLSSTTTILSKKEERAEMFIHDILFLFVHNHNFWVGTLLYQQECIHISRKMLKQFYDMFQLSAFL